MPVIIRAATPADATAVAAVAAITFPLACPPHTTDEAKAAFIAGNLTLDHFQRYIDDDRRDVLVAEVDGDIVAYVMLVVGDPADPDVAAAITVRPTIELSKFYVLPGQHGNGLAAQLMQGAVVRASERRASGIWLGVNDENARANRFYEKNGFVVVGRKSFHLGGAIESDFVRERVLA